MLPGRVIFRPIRLTRVLINSTPHSSSIGVIPTFTSSRYPYMPRFKPFTSTPTTMAAPTIPALASVNGDLNNTNVMRISSSDDYVPEEKYSHISLAIPESEDDAEVRKKYRPFILSPEIAEKDWVARLELSTSTKMAIANLNMPDPTTATKTEGVNAGEATLESGVNAMKIDTAPHTPGLTGVQGSGERLKILVLYGSLRGRSFSRLLAYEASRILWRLGCDVRVYNPEGLPVKDDVQHGHEKVQELRELSKWSDGHVWVSPEQHGNLTAVFKNQIDWIPLSTGSVRPTQGRTLAIAQVNGGSQSFNAVNSLRILGRWMRMFNIPNQSSVPQAWTHFTDADADEGGNRMKPSGNRGRLVDCMEELVKYTIVMRPHFFLFGDRYSEREEKKAKAEKARKAQEEEEKKAKEAEEASKNQEGGAC